MNLTLRVLSKPDIDHLAQIYQTLSTDYDERVLPSMVNEVLKGTVVISCSKFTVISDGILGHQAQYNADQLLTMRDKVTISNGSDLVLSESTTNCRCRRKFAKT